MDRNHSCEESWLDTKTSRTNTYVGYNFKNLYVLLKKGKNFICFYVIFHRYWHIFTLMKDAAPSSWRGKNIRKIRYS